MRVISVIEDEEVIKKILKHLGLWDQKVRPPPKVTGPQRTPEYSIDYSTSQLPAPARPPSGGSDKWLYVNPECPEVYPPLEGLSRLIFKIGRRAHGRGTTFFHATDVLSMNI